MRDTYILYSDKIQFSTLFLKSDFFCRKNLKKSKIFTFLFLSSAAQSSLSCDPCCSASMARGKKAGIAAAADIAPAAAAQEAFPGLAAALDGAQRSVANHDKAVAALLRIYAQARTSEAAPAFQQELLAQYARALLVFKREQAVERVVEFFAKFVAAADKVKIKKKAKVFRHRALHSVFKARQVALQHLLPGLFLTLDCKTRGG